MFAFENPAYCVLHKMFHKQIFKQDKIINYILIFTFDLAAFGRSKEKISESHMSTSDYVSFKIYRYILFQK